MNFVSLAATENYTLSPIPSTNLGSDGNNISPNVLLIILILAIIFFLSGLIHLLLRIYLRPSNIEPDELEDGSAFQMQLQQLFHLHDSGVDQSFIDTLPIFLYKAIIGLKHPFDCAVCLCEFEADDKLRLLPKCSHAFHVDCIDTWLLSHSTCPLCRGALIPEFLRQNCFSPVVFVLESGRESMREGVPNTSSDMSIATHLSDSGDEDFGYSYKGDLQDVGENKAVPKERIVPVKLGKFRNSGVVEGSSSKCSVDGRRCFSMGSFQYVLEQSSLLQVPIKPCIKNDAVKHSLMPGHRSTRSELLSHSNSDIFKAIDPSKRPEFHFKGFTNSSANNTSSSNNSNSSSSISNSAIAAGSKAESFSVSKIWLHSKEKPSIADNSSRAISFRLPLQQPMSDELKTKHNSRRRAVSEIGIDGWKCHGSEVGWDAEVESCESVESQSSQLSFARRTFLRLTGRQNKVVHSSSTLPV